MDEVRSTELAIISSYPISMSGVIILLNTKPLTLFMFIVEVLNVNPSKHRDCVLLLTVSKIEFRGQYPYLDKLQDIGYIS